MKMEVNRLEKEELIYEVKSRGITVDDTAKATELRKTFRQLLKVERKDPRFTLPKHPFTFQEDNDALGQKMAEIDDLLKGLATGQESPEYAKLATKISHAYGRANKMPASTEDEKKRRSEILVSILGFRATLQSKARKHKRLSQTQGPLEIAALLSSTTLSSDESTTDETSESDEEFQPPRHASTAAPVSQQASSSTHIKSVPVYQWNLKFDGKNMSLLAFLDRVKELSVSRNVSKTQLVASASDLFTGQAKFWYTANCDNIHHWDDLEAQLKKEFLPKDWNEKLFKEVNQRTQGPDESIGMYIATMKTAFKRFTCDVPESAKLRILMNNISPFYQSQLGLAEINSMEELLELGRRLEERKAAIEAFAPPPRNKKFLEPDLAYIYSEPSTSTANCDVVSEFTCWNCGKSGHSANRCTEAKTKHCFKCGFKNHTVRTCPTCSKRQGNYQGRR